MSREYCEHCEYPKNVCICGFVTPIYNQLKIVVLQHPKETGHAKNTVKLASLCFTNIEVIHLPKDLSIDRGQLCLSTNNSQCNSCALLYPNEHSVSIHNFLLARTKNTPISKVQSQQQQRAEKLSPILQTLYVLDGSWRQAYAIYKSNPWLADIPQLHLDEIPEKQYEIRKSKGEHQLSTIEAIAYAVESLEGQNTQPALDLLAAFTQQFQSFSSN